MTKALHPLRHVGAETIDLGLDESEGCEGGIFDQRCEIDCPGDSLVGVHGVWIVEGGIG